MFNTNAVQDMTVSYGANLPEAVADQRTSHRAVRPAIPVLAAGSRQNDGLYGPRNSGARGRDGEGVD